MFLNVFKCFLNVLYVFECFLNVFKGFLNVFLAYLLHIRTIASVNVNFCVFLCHTAGVGKRFHALVVKYFTSRIVARNWNRNQRRILIADAL